MKGQKWCVLGCKTTPTDKTKPLKCGRCHLVPYCNKVCQKIDYRRHQKECLEWSTGSGSGSGSKIMAPCLQKVLKLQKRVCQLVFAKWTGLSKTSKKRLAHLFTNARRQNKVIYFECNVLDWTCMHDSLPSRKDLEKEIELLTNSIIGEKKHSGVFLLKADGSRCMWSTTKNVLPSKRPFHVSSYLKQFEENRKKDQYLLVIKCKLRPTVATNPCSAQLENLCCINLK